MSGAGMSIIGPIAEPSWDTYRRVIARFSSSDSSFALQITPPLAPPNGMSITAVFQVIQVASAVSSSSETAG